MGVDTVMSGEDIFGQGQVDVGVIQCKDKMARVDEEYHREILDDHKQQQYGDAGRQSSRQEAFTKHAH